MLAVACAEGEDNLQGATRNAYQINWSALGQETASIVEHRDVLAALFAVSTSLQTALAGAFANAGIPLC